MCRTVGSRLAAVDGDPLADAVGNRAPTHSVATAAEAAT